MPGRYAGVRLTRCSRTCPSCHAPNRVYTHPHAGTIVETSCEIDKCRIARTLFWAGSRRRGGEVMPLDDRGASRQMFAGGAA